MIRKKIIQILFASSCVLLLSLFVLKASARPQQSSQKDLEDKKKQLVQEIEYKKKLLEEVKGGKYKSMIALAILNNKIKDHERLIALLGDEIGQISSQINTTHENIRSKEKELKTLKENYARMVVSAYKNRSSYDKLMFIFCASDFNQAYERMKYYKVYSELRRKQALDISGKKTALHKDLNGLEEKMSEHNKLLSDKETEKNTLSDEKKNKSIVLSGLQKKENNIKAEIKRNKQQAEKIKKQIDKIIADAIKKQNELLASKNKNSKNSSDNKKKPKSSELKIDLTPEEEIVSKNFEGNAGKLPWPVEKGEITERFGPHEHPDLANIIVYGTGVEITSNKGAIARSVFAGEVMSVNEIDGVDGKVVIIRHGEYLSVYYALENVYVQKGDKVKLKQEIGKVLTDENGRTELHLQIYKGKKLLDPEAWIVSRN